MAIAFLLPFCISSIFDFLWSTNGSCVGARSTVVFNGVPEFQKPLASGLVSFFVCRGIAFGFDAPEAGPCNAIQEPLILT